MKDRNFSASNDDTVSLPPQVQDLPSRERELASAVYVHGAMTAKEVEARLSDKLSNAAIRSMLERLCRKGILKRRKRSISTQSCGRRIAFIYLPAIDSSAVRHNALEQLAADYFGGSLLKLAQTTLELAAMDPVHAQSASAAVRKPRSQLRVLR